MTLAVAVTNESHTIGSSYRRGRRTDSRARFPDFRGACRISFVRFRTRPMHDPAFQMAALEYSDHSGAVKCRRWILAFPSRRASAAVGSFGASWTCHRETFVHLRIRKSRDAMVAVAAIELQNNELIAQNEQLGRELGKVKAVSKGKQKPLVLTIKQYQAFVGHLSDMHRTMVVAAMCSGLRVSEVLALKWDQLDFANGGTIKTAGFYGQISMDPVLVESLLEWRNKTHGTGLIFPSHVTGRCYSSGPIQQTYFRPAAEKLGLVGVCWQTFPHSYRSWMDAEGTPAAVQQKLMRHAPAATIMHHHGNASSKPKAKANGKVVRQVPVASESVDDASDDASLLFES
jgi:integrase